MGASDDGDAGGTGGQTACAEGGATPRYFPGGPRLAFFVLLVAILWAAWSTVRPVVGVLLLAAAVASLTARAYRLVVARLGGRRGAAAALMVVALLVLVLAPLAALVVMGALRLAQEVAALPSQLQRAQAELPRLAEELGPRLGPRLMPLVHRAAGQLEGSIASAAPDIANRLGALAAAVGSAFVATVIGFFLFTITLFYFYVAGEAWRERLIRLVPIDPAHTRALLRSFQRVSVAVFVGNLGMAAFHGGLAGLGYWVLGVSAPLVWAVVTGIASFIPVFGTALVWTPLSLGLMLSAGWGRGALLLGWCAIVIGTADNFVRPWLMRAGLGLHPLLVFVAVIGGLGSFGWGGLFLGPLVIALTVAALDIYERDEELDEPPPASPPPRRAV